MIAPVASVAGIATAGQGIGAGIGAIGFFHFLKWLLPFLCQRMDKRAERIAADQDRLDTSLANRLRKLEAQEVQCGKRIRLLVRAVLSLSDIARKVDGNNPKLGEIGEWLAQAMEVDPDTPADMQALLDQIR